MSKQEHFQSAPEKLSLSKRVFDLLWAGKSTNTLQKSYFVSSRVHSHFRWSMFLFNLTILIITVIKTPPEFGLFTLLSYLTIWGFLTCFIYSLLIILWQKVSDDSVKWKIVYILGEVAFALETMICLFYMILIFPTSLARNGFWKLLHELILHLIIPIFVWIEALFSDIAFPKGHRFIVFIVLIAYLINNMLWTLIRNRPVYKPIDWISPQSYILKFLAGLAAIGGFMLGEKIYQWKLNKSNKSKQTEKNN